MLLGETVEINSARVMQFDASTGRVRTWRRLAYDRQRSRCPRSEMYSYSLVFFHLR